MNIKEIINVKMDESNYGRYCGIINVVLTMGRSRMNTL